MGDACVIEGVTINELQLQTTGAGPGCPAALINPAIGEVPYVITKVAGRAVLKNMNVTILCPGTAGAIQNSCVPATAVVKKSVKNMVENDKPLLVGDTLVGGICTGTYQAGTSRVPCTCSFTIVIKASKQQQVLGS